MGEPIRIDAWISTSPVVIEAEASLGQGLQLMSAHRIGALPVLEKGRLAGIFTERDVLKLFASSTPQQVLELMARPVSRFMTRNPVTAQVSEDYDRVYMKMKANDIRHIPVLDGERLAGIVSMRDLLHFYQNKLEGEFNDARRELEGLRRLVGSSADERTESLAREVDRYRELSLTDELTGLFNKRYFLARLGEEAARARRYAAPLALIFCDLDHFKNVNDNYGHGVGDEVLREAAQVLRGTVDELNVVSRLRKSDIVARYGGEEFVIILPETGLEGARGAAEKLRREIEAYRFRVAAQELRLTMSFGVAELREGDSASLLKNADYAMYVAKNGGRNRVAVYSEGPG